MLTDIQFRILKRMFPGDPFETRASAFEGKSKLAVLLGEDVFEKIAGKVVIDFGCGEGSEAIEMARRGAARVIGVDIREEILEVARQKSLQSGVQHACAFETFAAERADIVISLDAFEHFADPLGALSCMNAVLKPEGEVLISFGPPWYHPVGGHSFSVFPWAHLLFSEKALIRWRSTFKTDGATRFSEVAGGLNQMTITRFVELVGLSPFRFASLELVPIRPLRRLHNRFTREFTTAIVRCRLSKRALE